MQLLQLHWHLSFIRMAFGVKNYRGGLKNKHIVIFCLGLIFDTLSTIMMSVLSEGNFKLNFHGISGFTAILLMLFHAIWAIVVLRKNDENMKKNFHKFSIVVWLIWLVPYISGMLFGMGIGRQYS